MTTVVDGPAVPDAARRREQRAWYWYDWANSAFTTTVVTVFLGPYLTSVARQAADGAGFVHPLGIPVRPGSYYAYVVSFSVLLSVVAMPLVGAIADRTQRKRELLAAFTCVGAVATMGLGLVTGGRYLLGGGLFLVANVCFGVAVVLYHSMLPQIATPDERDAVSSRGWAMGYLGGGLLLAANLALYASPGTFGLDAGSAARLSLFSAGAWWALFALVSIRGLRDRPPLDGEPANPVGAGFRQLARTLAAMRAYPKTLLFLAAYLLYNDGIQTVIALAATYGAEELKLPQQTLIVAVLVVQLLAFAGALLLALLARRYGTKRSILTSLVVWVVAVGLAYFLPARKPLWFFALAVLIGLVLGGSQALSRSLFSQLIPSGKEAEYFSVYEISDKGTSWLGPLLFGLTFQLTGSYRDSIVSLVVFFVAGFTLLALVPVRAAIREAGNQVPERV
ncbi:putative integral membrane protein [Carbonactinospora thermoautotrophica]|uniref:Putative integral membrane protein n=1 Tax=Carbonactinospora thermoautotrophica TaxID=1469144 RepID=A0A132MSW6_9ACTN|nr:MFS transporter [Carbonactinospora thermoautotrophica]KWX00988.1 putative integral membrane protein [Carbonactinospora thermoautotrophica]